MRLKVSLLILALVTLLIGQAVLAQSAQDTVELVGTIEAVNADGSIVVNGQTITITTAELNVALATGQVVKVEGTLLSDGHIAAREVQAPDVDDLQDDDEIELIGIVDSFDGTTLVVSGIPIDVRTAEINSPIVVGQLIKVHASFDANGNLIARETDDNADDGMPSPDSTPEVGDDNGGDDDDDRPGEFEITGTLEQVGDGFIMVNGQTISITGAEIKNQLVVGALVKLHLSHQNGQLVAREVENARTRNRSGDDDNSGPGSDDDDRWDEVYTVRPGDTLSSIAARAGVTVEELARINNITDTSIVVAGSRLIVPHSFDDDDGGNSGPGSSDDSGDDDDDNSGPGSGDDDNSDRDDDDDGGNSGSGRSGGDDDGGNSGGDDDDGGGSGGDDDDD
jgi:uncharacterized membrane protein YgcG